MRIDETLALVGLDDDAVEDVFLGDMKHPLDGTDIHAVRRDNSRPGLQDEERDQSVWHGRQLMPKLVPQLQVLVALGFLILNPRCMMDDS